MVTSSLVMVEKLEIILQGKVMALTEPSRHDAHVLKAFGVEIIDEVSENPLVIIANIQTALVVGLELLIIFLS